MRVGSLASMAAACALAVVPAARAQAPDVTALSQLAGPQREARLLEGARKEGGVNVYTSLVVEDIAAAAAAFEDRYGVRVRYWRVSSTKILQRVLAEVRSGRYEFDVVDTSGPQLEALHREKMLATVTSPHDADLLPAAIRPHKQWVGVRLNIFVQAYNTDLVGKADLPRAYQDLLDPKWKGRLAIAAKDVDWFGAVVDDFGENAGLELFRGIASANGLAVRKSHTLLAGLVASGEVPLALTLYKHNAERLKRKGAPIEWFAIQPAFARVNGIAIARTAPRPHAALLFYDFMLSPEGQRILQNAYYVPTSLKLNNPATRANLKFIDSAMVLDQSERWEKRFQEVVSRRPR